MTTKSDSRTRTRKQGTLNTVTEGNPEAKIAAVRAIVAEKQYAKVDGVMVDLFSASAIVAVHDGLNEANRAKFLALPITAMASIAFKLIK